jgi:proline dehydrogenase
MQDAGYRIPVRSKTFYSFYWHLVSGIRDLQLAGTKKGLSMSLSARVNELSWLWQPPVCKTKPPVRHYYFKKRPRNMISLITFFARRWIAGLTLAQALDVVEDLNRRGFFTTLDHLGEDVTNEDETNTSTDQYIAILHALKERNLDRNVSVKLTQLGLATDPDLCAKNLERIVSAAVEVGGFVRVDIEGSQWTTKTFDVVKRVKTNAAPAGAAVQAMLKRSPDDVAGLIDRGIPIRLCKGAYKESAEIAYQKHEDIVKHYISLMKRLLTSGIYHGIATHDEEIIETAKKFIKENHIARDAFEFQMLMGMNRKLQRQLIDDGWRLRIYVPFGKRWLPYMLRRLREKKENLWFFVSHLFKA